MTLTLLVPLRRRRRRRQARELLFYPSADDMQHYPALLAGPPDAAAAAAAAADTHPLRKLQITAMAPLYLAHCRSWSLMKPFIESGGLQVRQRSADSSRQRA